MFDCTGMTGHENSVPTPLRDNHQEHATGNGRSVDLRRKWGNKTLFKFFGLSQLTMDTDHRQQSGYEQEKSDMFSRYAELQSLNRFFSTSLRDQSSR